MIRDAEFWMEARRKYNGGNIIFTTMLPLLHARFTAIDSGVEVNEDEIDRGIATDLSSLNKCSRKEPFEENKAMQLPNSKTAGQPVSPSVVRVLQQIMMFTVPLYALQYKIPAMSMGWRTSCVVDRTTKQLLTFGAGRGVKVPKHIRCRGCVAADDFFAVLTDQDEVWASGGLNILTFEDGNWISRPLGKEDVMSNVATRALLLVGHGSRLACLTRAFCVRPLSIVSNPVRSIIPSRHVRFLDLGYAEDYYMVGTDAVLYKTLASKRILGTPRRVMAFSRTAVSRVASGTGFCLIIDQNGHLYTVGRNKKGQLGNGQQQNARRKPFLHKDLRHHFFVLVSAGDTHSLALTSSGIVYGAGNNENGQLGLGKAINEMLRFTPIPLPSKCVGIAAGPAGSMFACEDGHVYSCGLNDHRQLGLDTPDRVVYTPTCIPIIEDGVEAYTMDFGAYHKPLSTLHDSLLSPPVKQPPPVSTQEEEVPQVVDSMPLVPSSVAVEVPEAPKFEPTELPLKKKQACGKCCVAM